MRIRTATVTDLPMLRAIAAQAFDLEPVQRAGLVDLMFSRPGQEQRLCLVAEAEADDGVAGVGGVDGVAGFAVGSSHADKGFVDAIAVTATHRRRGVATALLSSLEAELGGASTLQFGGNTWYYAWPGIDLGYTAALCFAERAGYTRIDVAENMDVPLADWIPGRVSERTAGAPVRRAGASDWPELEQFVGEQFGEIWRHEAGLVIHRDPATVFLARDDQARIVGFACHGVYRVDWFGPIGTAPATRGSGVGESLLRACLDDLAAAGIACAQICWIGPAQFYSRTVGARLGRRFAILRKPPAS